MGRYIPGMLVLLALLGQSATANDESVIDINKAGRQRMLTQRIVKAYCLVGQDIRADIHKQQLDEAVGLFDRQLRELRAASPTPEISAALVEMDTRWSRFREIVTTPPTRAGAQTLVSLDEELLAAAENVVQLLQAHASVPEARLVNLSGRMRMLSQRVAKFYMLKSWQLDDPAIANGMAQARSEFDRGLDELAKHAGNTPEIKGSLAEVRKQWNVLVHFIDREKVPMQIFAAMTAEKVFEIADSLTMQYERLASK